MPSETTTPNYGFIQPFAGEREWNVPLNTTIGMIDSAIAATYSGLVVAGVTGLSISGTSVQLTGNVHFAAGPGATINFRANTNTIEISGIGAPGGGSEAVSTIGILGDATTLTDDVKLTAGPHVTITRDSVNNAFQISGIGFYDNLKFNDNGLLEVNTQVDGPYVMNQPGDITSIRGMRLTAGTSGITVIDVAINSNSVFNQASNKLLFPFGSGNQLKVQSGSLSRTSFAPGDDISINIDQIEAGTPQDAAVTVEIRFK